MPHTRSTGLAICALLGLLDIIGLAGFATEPTPPAAVMIGAALLGVVTLVGVWLAWQDRRGGVATVVVSRVLSALLGIPVFFTDEAPGWAKIMVAVATVLTVVGVALVASAGNRRPAGHLETA